MTEISTKMFIDMCGLLINNTAIANQCKSRKFMVIIIL